MDERMRFGLYQSCGNRGSVGRVSVFWLRWCGWCRWEVSRGLDLGGAVLCLCEFGFSVLMTGPGNCTLFLADTCIS